MPNYMKRVLYAAVGRDLPVTQRSVPVGVKEIDRTQQDGLQYVNDPAALIVYDEMRRKDPQIRAVIRNTRLPILGATYAVVSENPLHQEFAERQIGITESAHNAVEFDQLMRDMSSYTDFGFYVGEISTGIVGGMYEEILDIGYRQAKTISGFRSEMGKLTGVKQQTLKGEVMIENFVHIAFDAESGNYSGIPLLESVRNDWEDKQAFKRYSRMNAKRFALGVPDFAYNDEQTSDDELETYKEAIQDYAEGELAGLLHPDTMVAKILALEGGQRFDNLPYIKYADEQISKNYLSMLIELGLSATGSRAVGGSFMSNFFNAEKAIIKQMVKVINKQVLCPILEANFGESDARLEVTNIIPEDMDERREWIHKFAKDGLISPDEETLENELELMTGENNAA